MRLGLREAGSEPGRGRGSAAGGGAGPSPPRAAQSRGSGSGTGHLGAEGSRALNGPGACQGRGTGQVPRQRVCLELEFGTPVGHGGGCPGAGPEGRGRTGGLFTGPSLGSGVSGDRSLAVGHEMRTVSPKGSGKNCSCIVTIYLGGCFQNPG